MTRGFGLSRRETLGATLVTFALLALLGVSFAFPQVLAWWVVVAVGASVGVVGLIATMRREQRGEM